MSGAIVLVAVVGVLTLLPALVRLMTRLLVPLKTANGAIAPAVQDGVRLTPTINVRLMIPLPAPAKAASGARHNMAVQAGALTLPADLPVQSMIKPPAHPKAAAGARLNQAAWAGAPPAPRKNARLIPRPIVKPKAKLGACPLAQPQPAAGARAVVLTAPLLQQLTSKPPVPIPDINGV